MIFLAVVWLAIALSRAKESKKVCNLTLKGDPATTAEDVFCPPWFVQEPNSMHKIIPLRSICSLMQ